MCGPVTVNLSGPPASARGPCARSRQIQGPGPERPLGHRRRPAAKPHARLSPERLQLIEVDLRPHPRHGVDEVLDHAVGLGVVDVEPVELAVADEIDPGRLLGVQHHAGRVGEGFLRWARDEPARSRVGAHYGSEDPGCLAGHGVPCAHRHRTSIRELAWRIQRVPAVDADFRGVGIGERSQVDGPGAVPLRSSAAAASTGGGRRRRFPHRSRCRFGRPDRPGQPRATES